MLFNTYADTIKSIIDHVGKNIVIGIPLGIGKPVGLINCLYQLAREDRTIDLTIITALTLARPNIKNELQKRLAAPVLERIIGDYEDPLFEQDRIKQCMPDNIRVIEFFLNPAKYLHNRYVQQNYISSTYTHIIRDILNLSINVIAQYITPSEEYPDQYSVSCNSDLFIDLANAFKQFAEQGKKIAVVGEVNINLPFMYGDAVLTQDTFTHIVDTKEYRSLFALPRDEISPQEHMIGLYTSALIKDNGCLQIGIGSLSNAVANALIMRHESNAVYQEFLDKLEIRHKFGKTVTELCCLAPFEDGLYASTELLSDEYLHLYRHGILKKRVYDHTGLQRLLNTGQIQPTMKADTLDILLDNHIINAKLTPGCVEFLVRYGIFKETVAYRDEYLIINSEKIPADLSLQTARQRIIATCLGTELKGGILIHAGFILGSRFLFDQLRKMPRHERQSINMTSVSRTNLLAWNPELLTLQRIHGRFVNSAMLVTLTGSIVSDALENTQEVSGVGGQFDFVNMAQTLPDARSIIICRSTRQTMHGLESNIHWDYSNNTIPRFLRDIVVTEYGIADCRSKTDAEIIKAMLNITDSRFQGSLLNLAKNYGKIEHDYEIPIPFRNNREENIEFNIKELQSKGYCQPYPFGTDLTEDELVIKNALTMLKYHNKFQLFLYAIKSVLYFKSDAPFEKYLRRMNLEKPDSFTAWIYKKILKLAINQTSRSSIQ
jgi:hypothetical protein